MMKKSCNGCKCIIYDNEWSAHCELGYKIEKDKTIKTHYLGEIIKFKPLMDCPKPKTYDEFLKIKNIKE